MIRDQALNSFAVYRWINPETTCDYPFLAVTADRSGLLSIGNYGLCFEWGVPSDIADYLERDFAPTGESVSCDFSSVRYLLDATFAGGIEFGLLSFTSELKPDRLQLSLSRQEAADEGPEYLISELGDYLRFYRDAVKVTPVSAAEHAMLDVCVSTFADLIAAHKDLISEPPPPRYRSNPPYDPATVKNKS